MKFYNHIQKHYVKASSGEIETHEPIKIKWECNHNMFVVKVDGIDYAVIDNVSSADDVDLNEVKYWVENTYYDEDYKSDQYVPARLKLDEFKAH